ncbi:hypothetical protein F4810DRAFT_13378 [Camillea tinctor]|nr:hypothetical protein F4810DRAFT_13378 [Camillea tinctor]
MATQEDIPEQLKERLIRHHLQTWRSKAVPVTMEEAVSKQFTMDGNKDPPGQVFQDANPKGFLFIPFDSSLPNDLQLREERYKLMDAFTSQIYGFVSALLDEEIIRYDLQGANNGGIGEVPPLASLLIHEKVKLVAKNRLLFEFMNTPNPHEAAAAALKREVDTSPSAQIEKYDPQIKVYLLRVRGDERLEIRDILLSHKARMTAFHSLLEENSDPYGPTPFSCGPEGIESMIYNDRLPELGPEESRVDFMEKLPRTWCYRLVKTFTNQKPMVIAWSDWKSVETEEQYKEMMELVQFNEYSLMVTSVSHISPPLSLSPPSSPVPP